MKNNNTILTGTFTSNVRGFGFVSVEGYEEDFFIPQGRTGSAFYGDTVEIRVLPEYRSYGAGGRSGHRTEAEVTGIVERGLKSLVGTFRRNRHFGFVIPDITKIPYDIYVGEKASKGAVDGHKVVLEITDYGSEGRHPEGRVTEILGHINDPGVDILSIIRSSGIPVEFPEDVMSEAQSCTSSFKTELSEARQDLRKTLMVTIDGEDAKDLDDAVSLSRKRDGSWELGIHIADVAEYVREDSALDTEARKRGTSVYLADRVIPMLPHALCNGICSLNQGEDRYALSCLVTMDKNGKILSHRICESLIRVDARLSYHGVMRLLSEEDDSEITAALERQKLRGIKTKRTEIIRMLKRMQKLSAILRANRSKRGAIDFDLPESKITLDEKGRPIRIEAYERSAATEMIEDFMLTANETVAHHFRETGIPFVYRSHLAPAADRIAQLEEFTKIYGYSIERKDEEITPSAIRSLLESMKGKKEEAMLSTLTLRSMQRAEYTTTCDGHFGLALKYYTHFTSPIRRYPDLQIHRIIKESLRGQLTSERISHYREILPDIVQNCSALERRSDETERETNKLKKAQYMQMHLGEEFEGVVSGVTDWGIYVMLPNTVEGLVRVSSISDDFYRFNEKQYALIGEHTGRKYELGQTVRVKVSAADSDARTVDFVLAGSAVNTIQSEKQTVRSEKRTERAEKTEHFESRKKQEKGSPRTGKKKNKHSKRSGQERKKQRSGRNGKRSGKARRK